MTHFLVWKTLMLTPPFPHFPHVHSYSPLESRARFKGLHVTVHCEQWSQQRGLKNQGEWTEKEGKTMQWQWQCHWAAGHYCGQPRFNPSRTFWGASIMQFRTLFLKDVEGRLYPLIPSHLQTRNYQELPQEVSTSLNFQFCACQSGEWISGQKTERGVAAEAGWCQVTPAQCGLLHRHL